jgi:hypothetical protein
VTEKKQHPLVNWRLVWVGIATIFGSALVYIGFKGWLNTFIGQLFAIAFFVVAIYGIYKQWWQAGTCLILIILSVAVFFASQQWMQGFINQTALRVLLNMGERAGQQLGEFQKSTTAIQDQVSQHQDELNRHQQEISNAQTSLNGQQSTISSQQIVIAHQQSDIASQQNKINDQQARLDEQEKKLSDIEGLVRGFYDRSRTEDFKGSDTNRVYFAANSGTACWVFFRFSDVPIKGSIQGSFDNFAMKAGSFFQIGNIVGTVFSMGTNDCKGKEYTFAYTADLANNNLRPTFEVKNGIPFLQGINMGKTFFPDTNTFTDAKSAK